MEETYPIVLFDGVCNYCNSSVNFAIRNDKKSRLRFSPLQSATGQALSAKYGIGADVDSLIFIENNKAYTYSNAVLGICKYLDWPAKALYAFSIFPDFIAVPFYKWFASNRYKWFGKKEVCMLPTEDIKSRFLA